MKNEYSSYNSKRLFFLLATTLILISGFLHFFRLDNIPPGFFADESAIGYNAWSILETGKDEYGTTLPLFFRCFDNYHEPVMIYTLVPLIKIFGLSIWTVRVPEALYMIFASVMFYFLARQYTKNRYTALAGAYIFSIIPWAFVISRSTMSGYTPMLLGITAGCFSLRKMLSNRSRTAAIFAGISWAFTMYAHNCGRPSTAAYLVCFVIAFNFSLLKRIKLFLTFIGSLLLASVPMMIYYWHNSVAMTSRFNEISVWKDAPSLPTGIARIATRYIEYFSPHFLFLAGDPNLRHNSGAGTLFFFIAPFIAAGLYQLIRHFKRNPYFRFILLALLVYPCAAMLTEDHYHSTRSLNGMPFWLLTALIGAIYLLRMSKKLLIGEQRKVPYLISTIIVSLSLCFGVFEISSYFKDYFSPYGYSKRAVLAFNTPLVTALEFAGTHLQKDERLFFSRSMFSKQTTQEFKPYTYASLLFFLKIPPDIYQKEGIPTSKVCFYNGKYENKGILITPNFRLISIAGQRRIIGFMEKIPPGAKLLGTIPIDKAGHLKLCLYQLTPVNNQ